MDAWVQLEILAKNIKQLGQIDFTGYPYYMGCHPVILYGDTVAAEVENMSITNESDNVIDHKHNKVLYIWTQGVLCFLASISNRPLRLTPTPYP